MQILDLTAGSLSMWFDTPPEFVTLMDLVPKSSRVLKASWAEKLPFDDHSFDLVVFDPPHLTKTHAGTGIIAEKYGHLFDSWETDLRQAFSEAFRILKPGGILVFKWNTRQISASRAVSFSPVRPLFGHTSSWTNKSSTIWALFIAP